MRLIDATTLQLQSFMDESEIPPYAILSHTWGPDEVTLQQFTDQPRENSEPSWKSTCGYWKILKACQQALEDGFHHVWVDTCCIDKTSSAELSEAINSMFRWYKKAEICYAYLDDVNVDRAVGVHGYHSSGDEHFSKDELARSRWFTRGWTLQELIAPTEVSFYVKGWKYIGSKTMLVKILDGITGIDADMLLGRNYIGDESIAKRMSWMAGRTTTRTEDMAYSLMGIFDVNMPLLYGEGDKAFIRLQEEIMKDSADHSLFAWDSSATYSGGACSIFASHPDQFMFSRGIANRRFDDKDRLEEDFSCTNRGVKIKLRVRGPIDTPSHALATGEEHFLAVLDCCFEDPKFKNCWPAITIRRLTGSKSQYVRIQGYPIVSVVFGEVSDAQKLVGVQSVGEADGGEWVYLRKKVPGWAFVEFICKRSSNVKYEVGFFGRRH